MTYFIYTNRFPVEKDTRLTIIMSSLKGCEVLLKPCDLTDIWPVFKFLSQTYHPSFSGKILYSEHPSLSDYI